MLYRELLKDQYLKHQPFQLQTKTHQSSVRVKLKLKQRGNLNVVSRTFTSPGLRTPTISTSV
ncbi:hypothetical protein DFQ08_103309 [Winogradskyella arenosi]|uniref:Uncharacterized protein n=1 Tax=Winogradskyella arenosi TaxID=533325 RepID=A0A368ZE05_9FLAO|nr:hypothetical protein DFQ08_103308 [Winogradskyella arenosi]RCW91479.1 hypothetical protein DFQ08_103309 [Winogradskyella arenosi]